MSKAYINKLTHKDGNKLGKRKREQMLNNILKTIDLIQEYTTIGYR